MGTSKKKLTVAEQSALTAMQEELDRARLEHLATQKQLEQEVAALQDQLAELDSQLARCKARERELLSQLNRKS
jgi:hypothetical protein